MLKSDFQPEIYHIGGSTVEKRLIRALSVPLYRFLGPLAPASLLNDL